MNSTEIFASGVTFILNHFRATGSINLNLTDLIALGNVWGSGTLINVGNSLSSPGNGANVGDIRGNRIFYTNDYMVSDQGPRRSNPSFLTYNSRFTADQVTSAP